MMLEKRLLSECMSDLSEIKDLYIRSFPINECREFDDFLHIHSKNFEPYIFYKDNMFVGFAFLLNYKDISHILYLSILEQYRNQGLGSEILSLIHDLKINQRIIVDVERQNELMNNNLQRIKRKQFYFRNGYKTTDIKYRWRNEDFDVLIYGNHITYEEFENFWENVDF